METDGKQTTNTEKYVKSDPEMEEDILKILCLWRRQKIPADPAKLCSRFALTDEELQKHLHHMEETGILKETPGGQGMELTAYGLSRGEEYLYHYTSISQLLQLLGVRQHTADDDACRMEHILSEESIKAICYYVNFDTVNYERRVRNSDLTERYDPGRYRFRMQMYTMDHMHPRRLCPEYALYRRDVFLEIGRRESWFELCRADGIEPDENHILWYKNPDSGSDHPWIRAEMGETGERIPANVFEFLIKPNDALIEGNAMIVFTKKNKRPDMWNCSQLEVQIW